MSKPKSTDLKRIYKALDYSIQGLTTAWQNQAAFRQELFGCAVLIPLALWLAETGLERALLIFVVLLVVLVELLNSAIEAVVDRFGEEQHPLSGNAKDLGSAAVLISIIMALLVWALVLFG
ncbi:diacylglycerol kinase [Candidatus Spongiihabitans sp.]|uniref:diacylglycerol kinase n=1 Tax=Candidatus Spongiihabitans sp. TaxID=3101308 RepID=UPI003C700928